MGRRWETRANLYHVHPDATGYVRMSENFLEEVFGVQGVEVEVRD